MSAPFERRSACGRPFLAPSPASDGPLRGIPDGGARYARVGERQYSPVHACRHQEGYPPCPARTVVSMHRMSICKSQQGSRVMTRDCDPLRNTPQSRIAGPLCTRRFPQAPTKTSSHASASTHSGHALLCTTPSPLLNFSSSTPAADPPSNAVERGCVLVEGLGHGEIVQRQSSAVMGGEDDVDLVIYVGPLRMVVHLCREWVGARARAGRVTGSPTRQGVPRSGAHTHTHQSALREEDVPCRRVARRGS